MSILDRLARAEVSSDLAHHDYECHVDVLGAAGMAAANNGAYMAVFRIKYLNDDTEIESAKRLFNHWARRVLLLRKLPHEKSKQVAEQALIAWLDDVCHLCHGVKHEVIPGTPALSDRQCPNCSGTGKNPINTDHTLIEVFKDLFERADTACQIIHAGIKRRL